MRSIAGPPRARPARGQFLLVGIARPARDCWSRKLAKQRRVVLTKFRQRAEKATYNRQARFACRAAPAPGNRAYQYGTLYSVGGHGYSWAAAVAGTNARYLYFRTGGLFPQASTDRAYGLPLRCLQE